jgi:hypothetical protein
MGNYYAQFGGGRLETQVKLCAGRLPYSVIRLIHYIVCWLRLEYCLIPKQTDV